MVSPGKIAFPVILVLGAITGYITYTAFTAAIPEEGRIDSPYYRPLSPASGGNQTGNTGEAVQTAGGGIKQQVAESNSRWRQSNSRWRQSNSRWRQSNSRWR